MFSRHNDTPWAKIVAGLAALKVIPFKKALFGIAAIAGAVYAYLRLSNTYQGETPDARGGRLV